MGVVERGSDIAFPKLCPSEVETLAAMARLCEFADGEALIRAGERGRPFYVVEAGEVAVIDESGDEPRTVAVHGPGEFTGDVSILTDRPAVVSTYARGAARAYCVGRDIPRWTLSARAVILTYTTVSPAQEYM